PRCDGPLRDSARAAVSVAPLPCRARRAPPAAPAHLLPPGRSGLPARAHRRRAGNSLAVLGVADVLEPFDRLAVERLLDGDVGHGGVRRGAVPVLLAGRKPDDVARPDLLDRAALALRPAQPEGAHQGLTEPVDLP